MHTAALLINYIASCLTLIVVVTCKEYNKGLPNMTILPKSKDYKSPKGILWMYYCIYIHVCTYMCGSTSIIQIRNSRSYVAIGVRPEFYDITIHARG